MKLNLIPQAQAQCTDTGDDGFKLTDCLTLKNGTKVSEVEAYQTPAGMVNLIVTNLFMLAGVLIFIAIMVAGFKFVIGDTKGKDEAKTIATSTAIGFVVMFSAYWIIQIVEMVTGANIIF